MNQHETPLAISRLTSRDVQLLLAQGRTVGEIFTQIVGGCGPAAHPPARQWLSARLAYLKSKEIPVPPLPPLEELVDASH